MNNIPFSIFMYCAEFQINTIYIFQESIHLSKILPKSTGFLFRDLHFFTLQKQ